MRVIQEVVGPPMAVSRRSVVVSLGSMWWEQRPDAPLSWWTLLPRHWERHNDDNPIPLVPKVVPHTGAEPGTNATRGCNETLVFTPPEKGGREVSGWQPTRPFFFQGGRCCLRVTLRGRWLRREPAHAPFSPSPNRLLVRGLGPSCPDD